MKELVIQPLAVQIDEAGCLEVARLGPRDVTKIVTAVIKAVSDVMS